MAEGGKHLLETILEDDLKNGVSVSELLNLLRVAESANKHPAIAAIKPALPFLWFFVRLYAFSVAKQEKEKKDAID